MAIDYWRQFLKTGSVRDYLAYRNSVSGSVLPGDDNEQSNTENQRNSYQGSKDKGKR